MVSFIRLSWQGILIIYEFILGKTNGLSGLMFKSIHGRERLNGFEAACDMSWLYANYDLHVNPLSIGQIVNNHSSRHQANVAYEELNLEMNANSSILALLPNVNYDPGLKDVLRMVPLIATNDIHRDEELYSTYFSIVHK